MSEEEQVVPTEEEKFEEQQLPNIRDILNKIPSSPTQGKIEEWKAQHGEVFTSVFTEEEAYIWRCIRRSEWTDLQKQARTPPQEGQEPFTELMMEEKIVGACVLWSANATNLQTKGGTITTLSEQILLNSNFMNTGMASALVAKL